MNIKTFTPLFIFLFCLAQLNLNAKNHKDSIANYVLADSMKPTGLLQKITINAIQNKKVKEWLDNGQPLQASVRMIYVKLLSAFNTDDKDFAEQKAVFDKYYPLIANKDEFEEIKYFWVVKEAQNKAESSLLPYGSNSATGRIETKEDLEIEAVEDTSNEIPEPSIDTQTEQKNKVIIF